MFRIPLTHTRSRRDLAGSLRNWRPRKHARLPRRRLQAERLENRQLLADGLISGQVFNDLDADGLKDAGESRQSGCTIYLDADGNGELDAGETSATTLADGSYRFEGLAPGAYTVAEVQQSGWRQTYPVGTAAAIERVSVAADGTQANGTSGAPRMSADGRYVAFYSQATNLVPGDTNGQCDIFVYDSQTDTIERVSVAADGTEGNDGSYMPSISADGRYVAFYSGASNLVPGDTNGQCDIFVYDRQTRTIELLNVATDGTQGNNISTSASISADGRYVAFSSQATNLVPGDTNGVQDVFVTPNPFAPGSHVVVVEDGQEVSAVDFGNASLTTKFCVVNDASQDRTYEYNATGGLVEAYGLNSGNTAPRGAASTIAGDKTWVVDANRKVYVYDNSGALLGSWTAGSLSSNATVEGIATNGTDVWIVDAKTDKVFKYTGAATRLSGSQNAASSFNLNSSNTSPKDIVTNGASLWVVNDSTTDKVFKYSVAGSLQGSWTITSGGGSPTGITLDPGSVSNLWIVDSATDRIYQYDSAASRTSGSQSPSTSFALAAGNTNPQGIADPPVPGGMLATETPAVSASVSPAAAVRGADAALASLYYASLSSASSALRVQDGSLRIDAARLSESLGLDANTRALDFAASPSASRIAEDYSWRDEVVERRNDSQAEVDDLFAQWEADPLGLLISPEFGV